MSRLRHLLVVLGDQLDLQASCFDSADAQHDAVWMAEVAEESTHVWSSKPRIALFLAAMRHHAQALREAGWRVDYRHLDDPGNLGSLGAELRATIARLKPQGLVMTAPGDWRVLEAIKAVAADCQLPLDIREDRHFFSTVRDFAAHAKGRKQLRLEYWYRELRVRHQVLMDGEQPVGGQWNFDADNREAFGKEGPPPIPAPARFEPNETTRGVLQLVAERFAAHPGSLDSFAWPVTREQALQSLERFIRERLPHFGRWQDAMWTGEVWLFHSHLAAALNLKLLTAREVVQAAEAAYRRGEADLASTEGFIRQILGWREYVRGVYWLHMPQYLQRNALAASRALPGFFWNAQTDMACLRDALELTLAGRFEHFSIHGQTTKPKASLVWMPVSWLKLRGSAAESFRAPNLVQTNITPLRRQIGAGDPYRAEVTGLPTDSSAQRTVFRQGNEKLQPEQAKTALAGLVMEVPGVRGLSLNFDYYRLNQNDVIENIGAPGTLLRDELYLDLATQAALAAGTPIDQVDLGSGTAGYKGYGAVKRRAVTAEDRAAFAAYNARQTSAAARRAPVGEVESIIDNYINLSGRDIEGYEVGAQWRSPRTRLGSFALNTDITRYLRRRSQATSRRRF